MPDAATRIQRAFDAHGVTGSLHAVDLDSGRDVAVAALRPMPLASVFKVALATAVWVAADRGALDPSEQVDVVGRSSGPTGLGAMCDPARVSIRDLAYLALALSDNGAADVLLDRVGLDAVNAVHADLGMSATTARQACRDFGATIRADTATATAADAAAALARDPSLLDQLRARDPARGNGGPAIDQTRLLAALWTDAAATPRSCAAIRRLMQLQVWPHRLATGFPEPGMVVAGKTGTLPGVRNEIGVVEDAAGRRVAVAVLTTSPSPVASMPHLDALIGTTARLAYDELAAA